MTYMDYLWSGSRALQKCEPAPAHAMATPEPLPPPSTIWIWYAVFSLVVVMTYARLHRPRRLRRGSIWHNPVTGSATLYL
jgi:hypothetical protein